MLSHQQRISGVATGLIALLDDVAALAKMATATLDDAATQAAKAGSKALGVVVDDAAVSPRYVVGFASNRELPIVWRIAKGSLKNKLFFLLPGALILSLAAPWLVTPLLALGGAYLCYEGAEKVVHSFSPAAAPIAGAAPAVDPREMEEQKVSGAIRTDFILSAEIMAIALASVATAPLVTQAAALAVVGIGLTMVVYGAVALIVRADDMGVSLSRNVAPVSSLLGWRTPAELAPGLLDRMLRPLTMGLGRLLVRGMPPFLALLALVGTTAMLWVGGGILLHALEVFGWSGPAHVVHAAAEWVGFFAPFAGSAFEWAIGALGAGIFGLAVGAALIPVVTYVIAPMSGLVRRLARKSTTP